MLQEFCRVNALTLAGEAILPSGMDVRTPREVIITGTCGFNQTPFRVIEFYLNIYLRC